MSRRCMSLRSTVVLLALFVASASRRSAMAQQSERSPLVGALPFTNGVLGDERVAMNPLTSGIPELVLSELARDTEVRTVEPQRLRRVLALQKLEPQARMDAETASHVGRVLGAQRVIRGVFTSDGRGSIRILAQVVDVTTARVEHDDTVEGKQSNIGALIGQLAAHLGRDMRLPEMPRERREDRENAVRRASYQTTLLFARAIEARDGGRVQQAVTLLQELLATSPEYEPAKQELARLHSDPGR